MSTVNTSNPNPANEFQGQFGTPPGSLDPKAECEKWQQLCGKLLAERERLRAELDKARVEKIIAEWNLEPVGTMDEVYATVVRDQTIDELIAELENEEDSV